MFFAWLFIVLVVRSPNVRWRRRDLTAVLDPALNKRFLYLASPLVVQYAMQNWAWFVIQMIMSSECEDLASAYGEHPVDSSHRH